MDATTLLFALIGLALYGAVTYLAVTNGVQHAMKPRTKYLTPAERLQARADTEEDQVLEEH